MIVTNKLNMDLTRYGGNPVIRAMQDDRYSRNLEITLLSDGSPWCVPENTSVVIRYSKPDGKGGEYDTLSDGSSAWSITGNLLTVALAPQTLTVPGAVRLSVVLMQDLTQLSTFSVTLSVEPAVNVRTEESEAYFHVPGFLPAPAAAAPGQYLRVRSADSAGHVTATEAVSLSLDASIGEPARDEIPRVFFGSSLPQTKEDTVMPFRYLSRSLDLKGYCKTKAQGSSSMSYPKKNQTVTLYKDPECTEELNVGFRNWGMHNKFCLKANWIDLTHARNIVSAGLWADVVLSRTHLTALPAPLRRAPNLGAVDGFPVKVYAGGVYQGRYTLNIPKDAWMANMDDTQDNHCILCGEGYVSGCFREESVAQWTDEVHDTMPDAIQTRWLEVINFVMNSTDEEFAANIDSYIDLESLIDYHLFGLASCGLDAYGKNQLYMTYDGRKWIASMYDMDSTWGLWWDGSGFVATDYGRSEYQDYQDGEGNLLYIRLEACFREKLKARWEELKKGALSMANIIHRFEQFTDLAPAELVAEDYASTTAGGAFTGIPSQSTNNIQQIRAYALARQLWVDRYFSDAAYPLADGVYSTQQGSVSVSGNHISVTKNTGYDTSLNVNLYDVASNTAYTSVNNYSQNAYYTIPAGSEIVFTIDNWNYQDNTNENSQVRLYLKDTQGVEYAVFNMYQWQMTDTAYTAALTAEADIPVGCVGIYIGWTGTSVSWSTEFDFGMQVDGVKYV